MLDRPAPVFLGQQPHKGNGVLNGSIQGVIPHVLLDKTGECAISLGKRPHSSICEPGEDNHWDVWPADKGY